MAIFAIVLITARAIAEISEDEGVWVLNESNFNEGISIQSDLLVEFYAPWCVYCQELAPEYSRAALRLLRATPPIRIAKVDATENEYLVQRFGIEGLPTLIYYINGVPTEYNGARTEENIVEWVLKKNKTKMLTARSLGELTDYLKLYAVTLVLFAAKDAPEVEIFEVASRTLEGAWFILSTAEESLERYNTTEPSMIMFKHFDDKLVRFDEVFGQNEISVFLQTNKNPWVREFNQESAELIFKDLHPVIFLFTAEYGKFQELFTTLSQEFKETLLFCQTDLGKSELLRLSEYLGLTAQAQTTAMILDSEKSWRKYRVSGEITLENLRKFINDWTNGELLPYFKSQEIPEEDYENNVRVLVARNFEEIVYDRRKDVLVEFYAPWCTHCHELQPEYEKLARMLEGIDSIIIAKIDGTANEVPGVSVRGFPTLRFYSAIDKNGIDFNGDRTLQGILEFITMSANLKFSETSIKNDL